MRKVQCSKYPEEKCKYCEDKTFEKCEFCIYNLYHDCKSFKKAQDFFEKANLNTISIDEFAKLLDGREYREEITEKEEKQAKELGLVIVFGASDDLTEFRGAIDDEVSSYNGGEIYLDKNGILEGCECECVHYERTKENSKIIEALCYKDDYAWSYTTEIPHKTFDIHEDNEKFCKGIVFNINDL